MTKKSTKPKLVVRRMNSYNWAVVEDLDDTMVIHQDGYETERDANLGRMLIESTETVSYG